MSGADPGFKKGGGAVASRARSQDYLASLGDFLKNLGQKGVGVRPLRLPSGSAPECNTSFSSYFDWAIHFL